MLAALDAHPNIEIRLFNPYANRAWRLGELAVDLRDQHDVHLVERFDQMGGEHFGFVLDLAHSGRKCGAADILGRIAAHQLSASLGQQVVTDNRPGATGNIGAEIAARPA